MLGEGTNWPPVDCSCLSKCQLKMSAADTRLVTELILSLQWWFWSRVNEMSYVTYFSSHEQQMWVITVSFHIPTTQLSLLAVFLSMTSQVLTGFFLHNFVIIWYETLQCCSVVRKIEWLNFFRFMLSVLESNSSHDVCRRILQLWWAAEPYCK